MPLNTKIIGALEPKRNDLSQKIQMYQEDHKLQMGSYWQAAPLIETPPIGEVKVNLASPRKPSDMVNGWSDTRLTLPDTLPFTVQCHTYLTPSGAEGYEIIYRMMRNGVLYQKIENHGNETYREKDWHEVVDPNS